MKKTPNLYIVGEQKTGTSSLYQYLSQHPDILMSTVKEPQYLCKDFHEESDKYYGKPTRYPIRTPKEYQKMFKNHTNEKIIGEASAVYLYSKVAAEEIKKLNPKAKIIIILREPVSFLYSLHAQYVKEGRETILDFKKAIEAEKDRQKGEKLNQFINNPSLLYYKQRAQYDKNLARYIELFPKEQLKIIISEDFRKNTENITKEVFDYLNIDKQAKINYDLVNVGGTIRNPVMRYIACSPIIGRIKQILFKMLSAQQVDQLTQIYHKITRKPHKRDPLDEKLKNKLKAEFAPMVDRLQSQLDSLGYKDDLRKVWGYKEQKK